MSGSETQDRWLEKLGEQLRGREGVTCETLEDGRIALEISHNGQTGKLIMPGAAGDYRTQKNLYTQMRETLTRLGIIEGQEFVAPRRSRKPMTPEMVAARAKQKEEFEAWQEVWRMLREAEQSLDVEFEIAQMLDYY